MQRQQQQQPLHVTRPSEYKQLPLNILHFRTLAKNTLTCNYTAGNLITRSLFSNSLLHGRLKTLLLIPLLDHLARRPYTQKHSVVILRKKLLYSQLRNGIILNEAYWTICLVTYLAGLSRGIDYEVTQFLKPHATSSFRIES